MSSHHRAPLPSEQHEYEDLPRLGERVLHARREGVFLVLSGLFLGTLAMLNILGITRFIVLFSYSEGSGWTWGRWGELSFALAVGVLPYPLTFLCTDFISELYGRARANGVVWTGFLLNIWVIVVLWLGGVLPETPEMVEVGVDSLGRTVTAPPFPEAIYEPDGTFREFRDDWTFYRVRQLAFGAVAASMVAYLVAQLVDVHVFHFWKRLTKNKHLWIRNNGSTLVSQLVDTTAVILITHFYARALRIDEQQSVTTQLLLFIGTGYVFKVLAAAVDTLPFYAGSHWLARYLRLRPPTHGPERRGAAAVESGVG